MHLHFRISKRSRYPWLFIVATATANFAVYGFVPEAKAFELYLPVTAAVAGFVHFLYSQHHQETQLFVNLFEKFNGRYNSLNEQLNIIALGGAKDLTPDQTSVLFDYFNLCAEEFLFYKSGYIDHDVWQSWIAGMKYFARSSAVRSLWETEINGGSYYGFNLALLDAVP